MNDLKGAFAIARETLARDAESGLTSTFREKLALYRMARGGFIAWRNTVSDARRGIRISPDFMGDFEIVGNTIVEVTRPAR